MFEHGNLDSEKNGDSLRSRADELLENPEFLSFTEDMIENAKEPSQPEEINTEEILNLHNIFEQKKEAISGVIGLYEEEIFSYLEADEPLKKEIKTSIAAYFDRLTRMEPTYVSRFSDALKRKQENTIRIAELERKISEFEVVGQEDADLKSAQSEISKEENKLEKIDGKMSRLKSGFRGFVNFFSKKINRGFKSQKELDVLEEQATTEKTIAAMRERLSESQRNKSTREQITDQKLKIQKEILALRASLVSRGELSSIIKKAIAARTRERMRMIIDSRIDTKTARDAVTMMENYREGVAKGIFSDLGEEGEQFQKTMNRALHDIIAGSIERKVKEVNSGNFKINDLVSLLRQKVTNAKEKAFVEEALKKVLTERELSTINRLFVSRVLSAFRTEQFPAA